MRRHITALLPLLGMLALCNVGCAEVLIARGGYSHPLSNSEAAKGAAHVDAGLGGGIGDAQEVIGVAAMLRSKFGPSLFQLGLYPSMLLMLRASSSLVGVLQAGASVAGVDVVAGETSFSRLSPFAVAGIGYRPDGIHAAFTLDLGADYNVRGRADVPNIGYVSLSLGIVASQGIELRLPRSAQLGR